MSGHPDRVQEFYADLGPNLRLKAQQDFDDLQQAKREHMGDANAELKPFDVSYYLNRLKRERFSLDPEIVRQYFPLDQVREGMFRVTQELFGLHFEDITERAAEEGRLLWHADVQLFEVQDAASREVLGEFYTDMHPRKGKYSHAAQFPLVLRKRWADGSLTLPRVALVCNFTKPTEEKPSLLSHGEVTTFFHEFGHCLHSLLTESDWASLAGTNVARDFVETPSQLLENWCWDRDVLRTFAKHFETGEVLPDALLQGMLDARNLGSGLACEVQVFHGRLDLAYHTESSGEVDTSRVRRELYAETTLFSIPEGLVGQASFGHLVGYQAGYYGYLWSLVYSCDIFARFEAEGIMNTDTAQDYRKLILSRGGTQDEMDMVTAFLGREPNSDAFLRHLGLDPVGS